MFAAMKQKKPTVIDLTKPVPLKQTSLFRAFANGHSIVGLSDVPNKLFGGARISCPTNITINAHTYGAGCQMNTHTISHVSGGMSAFNNTDSSTHSTNTARAGKGLKRAIEVDGSSSGIMTVNAMHEKQEASIMKKQYTAPEKVAYTAAVRELETIHNYSNEEAKEVVSSKGGPSKTTLSRWEKESINHPHGKIDGRRVNEQFELAVLNKLWHREATRVFKENSGKKHFTKFNYFQQCSTTVLLTAWRGSQPGWRRGRSPRPGAP